MKLEKKIRKNVVWIALAVILILFIKDNGFAFLGSAYVPGQCKDLGLGIDKLCFQDSDSTIGASFDADNFYFDANTDTTSVKYRVAGSDWQAVNIQDWGGHRIFFRTFNSVFEPFGRQSNRDIQVYGYKMLTHSGEFWSNGHGKFEKETVADRRNYVNKYYFYNFDQPVEFSGKVPSSGLVSSEYRTDILGKYCGTINQMSLSSTNGYELSSADYEFYNIISPCPDRYTDDGNGAYTIFYDNHPNGQIVEYISVLGLYSINGNVVNNNIGLWIDDYNSQLANMKSEWEGYMRSFKFPSGTNDEKLDYYRFLLGTWMGVSRPVLDNPGSLTDYFNVAGKWRYWLPPNIEQYKQGTWIWDSGMNLQGILAAYNPASANAFVKELINDVITTWAVTINTDQPNRWYGKIYTGLKDTSMSQPSELYVPVTLAAYHKGIITQDLMCNQMLPALDIQYQHYKQSAGSDYLVSFQATYGRDGTSLTKNLYGNSAETGATTAWAMMAVGLASMSNECGLPYNNYVADYNNIKSNFESLWRDSHDIYWNLDDSGAYYEGSTLNIGTTPYGVCMAVLADLVPQDRIERIFNTLETYYVDGLSTFTDGIGYTSVATTATYYDPYAQWDGPFWEWVDGIVCTQAIDYAVNKYGLSQLGSTRDKIHNRNFNVIGRYSIYPMESYHSRTGNLASWSARPYMPAGVTIPTMMNNYNIYDEIDFGVLNSVPCTESWSCTAWSACVNNQQSRTCTDANACGTTVNKPPETQSCTVQCTENWQCSAWSTCVNNQQTRTCNDLNNCGTTVNKPAESQTCTVQCTENWDCTGWSNCIGGQMTRTCTDLNNCGTTANKPSESQTCTCVEDWTCTAWSSCVNNQQTRTCTDNNQCGTTMNKPVETSSCTTCIPSWQCTQWSQCLYYVQTRTCTDVQGCGIDLNKPAESQACTCHPYDISCDGLDETDVNLKIDDWKQGTFTTLQLFNLIKDWRGG